MWSRRVEKILPSKAGLKKLVQKRKIKLYIGVDPTGSHLHLGHTIGIRQLVAFAERGHEAILLFGTGTVLVGDPSQREEARKPITEKEIKENIKTWKKQLAPVIRSAKIKIVQNSDWLLKLTLKDIIKIASNISAVQLFKRDMFQRRIKQGNTVWYHETMYPLLQGYDSVVLDVDLEIGGTDQEFNMLIGRELAWKMKKKEKYVMTTPMILGIDGTKMSKSTGNCVWLDDSPTDMFAKLMGIPDNQISTYLRLVTNLPFNEVKKTISALDKKEIHPMEAKKILAQAVVAEFHGEKKAQETKKEFEDVFQKKQVPPTIPAIKIEKGREVNFVALMRRLKIAKSNAEAKRLIRQGAVRLNGKKVKENTLSIKSSGILKIGKFRFFRLVKQ